MERQSAPANSPEAPEQERNAPPACFLPAASFKIQRGIGLVLPRSSDFGFHRASKCVCGVSRLTSSVHSGKGQCFSLPQRT